ncbi:histone-lysine N-methyltransferase SETD1B isoform X3 [Belonocnema kinseyi]|uniref:histone-lysine N-methyltransferase SETD1B isoform X3 n=1 Tax=Belonocnema kinseyi TaxID=2817044 RepID=UPI00143CDB89|nr:histone-lysine N-methyltransferase SETD1B isoform X3 [Belonocnema kinseyi]
MVCKENVVSWFGNLSSYKRIDVMCTLLNMCLPFEIRYIGACVEERGKRDYNDLRDTEHHANSITELTELTAQSVIEKQTRRKLVLYMALLQSCNYACAVVLYKNLANLDIQEVINLLNETSSNQDDQPLEELLLLYAMALNHPAFTYDQKNTFGNIFVKLQEEEARLNNAKSSALAIHKSTQSCLPCVPNDRTVEAEIPTNCMAPPSMKNYPGEMQMRGNTIYTGILPAASLQPPVLCLPSPEQVSMGTGIGTQYIHLGFSTMNQVQPWTGQVLMSNPLMYHTGDVFAYPPSPLVSRQSSPSQSRSPSRNNSPTRRNSTIRTSGQDSQPTSNILTTSTSSSSNQTNMSSSNNSSLPPLPSATMNRKFPSQQPLLPPRSNPPLITSTISYIHHNSIEMSSAHGSPLSSKQPPLTPRLRSSVSGDSLREALGKEMPNFKGNLQNYSLDEIRRMSDEDLREIGLTSNAIGQLRNIVKSQTSNGSNQLAGEKQLDSPNNPRNIGDQMESKLVPGLDVSDANMNVKSMPMQEHQPIAHHQGHATVPSMRRYPTMPPMDPPQMQMYTTPPPMYAAQSAPCYACLTVPQFQNRYSRCDAQHVYCLGQLQALRLEPESNRHCSQSSSSESTGSRSPPETPPAAPWVGGLETSMPPITDNLGLIQLHSVAPNNPPQPLPPSERPRHRKSQTHVVRHKNQVVNGCGPPKVHHCMSFPAPPPHSQVAYLPHGHYPALRPSVGLYTNFSPAAYARPAFPPTYQPNGEMLYPYHGHPGSGGTPPPLQNAVPLPQSNMPPTPVVTYTPAVPPAKISCYNCGSNNHLATDCKDLTMEDLTKRGQGSPQSTCAAWPRIDCPLFGSISFFSLGN